MTRAANTPGGRAPPRSCTCTRYCEAQAGVKVGEAVTITFEQDGDKNVATQITE